MTQPVINYLFANGTAENPEGTEVGVVTNCQFREISITQPGWGSLTRALEFNSTGSSITCPASERLCNTEAFAVELVLRPAVDTEEEQYLITGQAPQFSLFLQGGISSSFPLAGAVLGADEWKQATTGRSIVPLDTWTSVAMVFTGDDVLLFVNDVLTARRVIPAAKLRTVGSGPIFIGNSTTNGRNQFVGLIAGIRIWDEIPPHLLPEIERGETEGFGEITSRHLELGGDIGFMGQPVGGEIEIGRGRCRSYQGGDIYWVRDIGARAVYGGILARYKSLDGAIGPLGFPYTDELDGAHHGSRFNRFENGAIFWSAETGAHDIQAEMFHRYMELGGDAGFLGLPTSDEVSVAGGKMIQFQGGALYSASDAGTFSVQGAILAKYIDLGGPTGLLGFPMCDESNVLDKAGIPSRGRVSRFQNGSIYWSASTGAYSIVHAIRELYERMGGPLGEGVLGYPISDETGIPDTDIRYNDFQHGIILWKHDIGARVITELTLRLGKVASEPIDDGWGWRGPDHTAELVTYTTVQSGTIQETNKRRPDGHAGPSYDINATYTIAPVRHDTTIFFRVKVEDYDEWSGNEHLGTIERTLDIHSLWGLLGGETPGVYINQVPTSTQKSVKFSYSIGQLTAIDPNKHFREQCWWRFDNFKTPHLSREQFTNTFTNVSHSTEGLDNVLHPWDYVFYNLVYKNIAKTGNCFGMSLEAIYSRAGRSIFFEPLYQHRGNSVDDPDNTEINVLWGIRGVLNDKHAYQIGSSAIRWLIASLGTGEVMRPIAVYERVKRCLATHDWPVLCMNRFTDLKGHCVLPYAVIDGDGSMSKPHRILVADPNVPWRVETGDPTVVEVYPNDTFRFVGGISEYHSTSAVDGLLPTTLLMAIPFHHLSSQPSIPSWELALLLPAYLGGLILMGGDAETVQLTGDGKDFYREEENSRHIVANGIPGMARIPIMDAFEDVPDFFAQVGRLSNKLEFSVRGRRDGQFTQAVASAATSIAIDCPISRDARDLITTENMHTARPSLALKTSQSEKIAKVDWAVLVDDRGRDRRRFSIDLPLSVDSAAWISRAPRGDSLTITPSGPLRQLTISVESVVDNQLKRGTFNISPPSAGRLLRIRPADWDSPASSLVVEHLSSIDGGVRERHKITT